MCRVRTTCSARLNGPSTTDDTPLESGLPSGVSTASPSGVANVPLGQYRFVGGCHNWFSAFTPQRSSPPGALRRTRTTIRSLITGTSGNVSMRPNETGRL